MLEELEIKRGSKDGRLPHFKPWENQGEMAQPNTRLHQNLSASHSKLQFHSKMQGQRGRKKAPLPSGELLKGHGTSQ
jgi:hypothetical protein